MTEERIDIEITDKVNPKVAEKIRAIAAAAREADSSVNELKRQLSTLDVSSVERLAAASAKVTGAQARQTSATARLTNAQVRQETSSVKNAVAQQRLATEAAKTSVAQSRAAQAATRAKTAAVQQEIATSRLAAAKAREAAALDSATQAQRLNNRIRQAGNRSQRQSLQQTQNLIFQLNDIVVGLASGQKPMTVLLQQGSQISTIYGPGRGVLGTLRLLGASLATIFLPLLPAIAAVAALGVGFLGLRNEIRKSTGVAVTFGDTFKAVFQVAGRAIGDFLQPAIEKISPIFTLVYETVVKLTKNTINIIVGSFVFAYNAIVKTFKLLPGAIKDIFAILVNGVLGAIEFMVNGVISGLNEILEVANDVSQAVGKGKIFEGIGDVDLTDFKLEVTGAAREVGRVVAEEANKAFTTDFAGQAFDAIANQAVENAKKRLAEEAKAAGASNKELSEKEKLLRSIKAPYEEYINTLKNANELLREGKITLEEYNTALAKTQLANDVRAVEASLPEFADQAALEELRVTQQERIAIIQQARDARILTEQEAADRIRAINQQLALDIANIESARQQMILSSAAETFDQLANAAAGFAGEQSALYQALFVTSKAFAIAESIIKIQQGIANALALPFPANLAAAASVAAAAANIVSSIQAVQFSAQGKKDGGFVSGPGGPRDDRVPAWLSNGEFVINAEATKRNRPLLEAINDNSAPRLRDGGSVGRPRQLQPANQNGSIGGRKITEPPRQNTVTINVSTPDAESFMRSRNQIAAAMARTVNDGYRNL